LGDLDIPAQTLPPISMKNSHRLTGRSIFLNLFGFSQEELKYAKQIFEITGFIP
jgi:hypothetical protein